MRGLLLHGDFPSDCVYFAVTASAGQLLRSCRRVWLCLFATVFFSGFYSCIWYTLCFCEHVRCSCVYFSFCALVLRTCVGDTRLG